MFIGIDPGTSGGIAALDDDGRIVFAVKMPETIRDIFDALEPLAQNGNRPRAVLERVNPGVFGGKTGRMGVTSAFTFGRGVGWLQMALTAARIPYDEVGANVWQKSMQCQSKGDKNVTKARAQQLFPVGVKITHALADALLIAEYCRRLRSSGVVATFDAPKPSTTDLF